MSNASPLEAAAEPTVWRKVWGVTPSNPALFADLRPHFFAP